MLTIENEGQVWQHYNPTRIVAGGIDDIGSCVLPGENVLLVTTRGFARRGLVRRLHGTLKNCNLTVLDNVDPNPSLDFIDQALLCFKNQSIDRIVALGGGSALDVGKALSLMIPCNIDRPLQKIFREGYEHHWEKKLPLIAIPTTAGTGAEVTNFATVWDYQAKRKYSLASSLLFPDVAYLDANLTITLPADETLYSGLDALSHALESLWNKNCTSVSRAMAIHSLGLLVNTLPKVLRQPDNVRLRSDMLNASLLSGLAISQTRTAIAHSISYPLTTNYSIPHGLACSFTLPALLRINLERIASDEMEKALFGAVLSLLEGLALEEKIYNYASFQEIERLVSEMYTPGRSDNYRGEDLGGVRRVLDVALKMKS